MTYAVLPWLRVFLPGETWRIQCFVNRGQFECKHRSHHLLEWGWIPAGPNFIELLSTKICLAWHFCLDKKQDYQSNFHVIFRIRKHQVNSSNEQLMRQMEIWLVILFLSAKKFHAKQFFVLSSSMKLCLLTHSSIRQCVLLLQRLLLHPLGDAQWLLEWGSPCCDPMPTAQSYLPPVKTNNNQNI